MSDHAPDRSRDLPRATITITHHGGAGGLKGQRIAIDGVDVTSVVLSATVRLRRGGVPVVVLEMTPAAVIVSSPAGVDVRLPTRRGTRARAVLDSPADPGAPDDAGQHSTP